MLKKLVIVPSLFISVLIAQGDALRHYFVRQNTLNDKKSGETPSTVLHMESQLGCGILCAQDYTCASLTHHVGQCLLYNSSVSTSDVPAPGARTFTKHGYVYLGCYLDDLDRLINDEHIVDDSMTYELCLTHCRQGNYLLAGLEATRHCFCGNSNDDVKYTVQNEGDCNTPCVGNSSQMCGGHFRLSLFQWN
ncbi:putative fungistatic metabolite [Haliotis rubra]|uniref:putative fungistatic metabolite n=1 Tax=Haliotis rubra TaxID=36100 RepID=UPI001EE5536A|nr:putative fungistatic metabolite [Haliotis rubra]